eukprot:1460316-Karenia_brevis.AAC.1
MWTALNKTETKSINIAYMRGLRAAAHKTFHNLPESPDEEVLVAAKAQPAEMRIAYARLRFLWRLLTSAGEASLRLVDACSDDSKSYASMLVHDFERML